MNNIKRLESLKNMLSRKYEINNISYSLYNHQLIRLKKLLNKFYEKKLNISYVKIQ